MTASVDAVSLINTICSAWSFCARFLLASTCALVALICSSSTFTLRCSFATVSCNIRMSANSCMSVLFCAEAGAASPATSRRVTESRVRFIGIRSGLAARLLLGGHHELGPPVHLPRAFVVAGVERELFAVADGLQTVGRDAEREQIVLRRLRAAIPQRQIVFGCAPLVTVTFDG